MKNIEVALNFRMQETTHAKLKLIAAKELRSLNSQMEYFLIKGIEEYETANGEIAINEDGEDA